MNKKYERTLLQFQLSLLEHDGKDNQQLWVDEHTFDMMVWLITNNSLENPLPRSVAQTIIEDYQKTSLDTYGGWPLQEEVSFQLGEATYSVIAFGASDQDEGKDAIMGMLFVKEEKE